MKFARYLQDTQTPEWKKAYIDYRGLKKRITAIRKVHEGLASDSNSGSEEEPYIHSTISETGVPELLPQDDITLPPGHARAEESALQITDADSSTRFAVKNGPRNSFIAAVRRGFGLENRRPVGTLQGELDTSTLGHKVVEAEQSTCHDPTPDDGGETHIPHPERPSTQESVVPRARQDTVTKGRESPILGSTRQKRGADSEKPILIHAAPIEPKVGGVSPSRSVRGRRSSFAYPKSLISGFRKQGAPPSGQHDNYDRQRVTNPMKHLPLNELLNQLDPTEQAFFTALDAQLDKIDCFYSAREKDMMARTKLLHEQLDELGDHKKLIQSVQSRTPSSWTTGVVVNIKDKLRLKRSHQPITAPYAMSKDSELPGTQSLESDESGKGKMRAGGRGDADVEGKDIDGEKPSPGFERIPLSCDPEDYLYAKKKLKKAVLEHYRGLEVLQNYRILNLTGFRKALKKFEKFTKIRAQHQYMDEKIERTTFSSGKTVHEMMNVMEGLYATRFARGDKKRAVTRLRAGFKYKSHHYSAFRSGICLGLALPAFVSGIYSSFQQSTRDDVPYWGALLFVYAIMFLPILFVFLVGINLLVWARSRINYVFVFELDTRTRLDYREYYEIPSVLLATLCYAFWLSFFQIGSPHISPQIWPLVWLGFCGLMVLQPLPLFYRPSRYWLVKIVSKLAISGTRRVEFADFWMGDQLCSLVFSLSNLYFFACVYARGFDEDWTKCGVAGSPHWPVIFVLASLPLLCRLVQSVKRYHDSGLVTHLINGGKYGSGIVSNLFFYLWRQRASHDPDSIFALWILFSAVYSIYASTWDFLMDWSILRLHAQYPLLRQELIYTDAIPSYYFAIITNVLIRFIWVIYIPTNGPSMYLRTFIGALLELFRRWQWNFFRLENEHLGNMDQYRITHEVPLPYSFDDAHAENADDGDDDDDDDKTLKVAATRKQNRPQPRAKMALVGHKTKKEKSG